MLIIKPKLHIIEKYREKKCLEVSPLKYDHSYHFSEHPTGIFLGICTYIDKSA